MRSFLVSILSFVNVVIFIVFAFFSESIIGKTHYPYTSIINILRIIVIVISFIAIMIPFIIVIKNSKEKKKIYISDKQNLLVFASYIISILLVILLLGVKELDKNTHNNHFEEEFDLTEEIEGN